MADCHSLLTYFNQVIRLTDARRHALLMARNDLRNRVNKGFATASPKLPAVHQLEFQTQGSFIMDTIINPISEDYDLDDGIYFIGPYPPSQRPDTKVFHDFVLKSVSTNNPFVKEVKDKDTCVRALYNEGYSFEYLTKADKLAKGFHVDLPIYYAGNKKCPDLAHLKKSWILSDPIEFIAWFEKKVQSEFRAEFLYESKTFAAQYDAWQDQVRKQDAQLRRIVRYFKAWCDYQADGHDMPCGLILTILAAENYHKDSRDDISLKETISNIHYALKKEFVCRRPTTPKDEDLLAGYGEKEYFMERLAEFADAARQAMNETNQKRACVKWQRQFGNRFSCLLASDTEENASSFKEPAIVATSAKSA